MQWHQYSLHTLKDALSLALKLDANELMDTFSQHDPTSSPSTKIETAPMLFDEMSKRVNEFQESIGSDDSFPYAKSKVIPETILDFLNKSGDKPKGSHIHTANELYHISQGSIQDALIRLDIFKATGIHAKKNQDQYVYKRNETDNDNGHVNDIRMMVYDLLMELLFYLKGRSSIISDFSSSNKEQWIISGVIEHNVLQVWQLREESNNNTHKFQKKAMVHMWHKWKSKWLKEDIRTMTLFWPLDNLMLGISRRYHQVMQLRKMDYAIILNSYCYNLLDEVLKFKIAYVPLVMVWLSCFEEYGGVSHMDLNRKTKEVVEMGHELYKLRENISTKGIFMLVKNISTQGFCVLCLLGDANPTVIDPRIDALLKKKFKSMEAINVGIKGFLANKVSIIGKISPFSYQRDRVVKCIKEFEFQMVKIMFRDWFNGKTFEGPSKKLRKVHHSTKVMWIYLLIRLLRSKSF